MINKETVFTKDKENKRLTVVRSFDASLEQVWKAWTTSEILDKWWAPKPYRAETKRMDFTEGGRWLYAMIGPEGDTSWCRVDYGIIEPNKNVSSAVMFCDEEGNENLDFPRMYWNQKFSQTGDSATVTVEISFDSPEDMDMFLKLGFQEGFTAGLTNLDEYFANH